MQKVELLHLHFLLVHFKKYYEEVTGNEIRADRYTDLQISPVHIHKNKINHKKAILTIGEELLEELHHHQAAMVDYTTEAPGKEIAVEH